MLKRFEYTVSRPPVIGVAVMGLFLLVATAIVVPHLARAEPPPSIHEGPVLDRLDLTGDGVPDVVRGYPHGYPADPDNVRGEVHLISGATGETLSILNGYEDGDRFGHAIAYAGDLSRDGNIDLIVGAPGTNGVFVIPGIFFDKKEPCEEDVPPYIVVDDVSNVAIHSLTTTSSTIYDVGGDVAAFYDFREDGYPTFRFTAKYLNDDNEEATREYIAHGYTGLIMARVERYIQRDGIERPLGDTTRDGRVHDGDLDVVISNLGDSGTSLTIDDGDVTEDQQVGPEDLLIVMTEQGRRLYDPTTASPPTTFNPADEGCDSYYARGDEGQWYHIELYGLGCVGPVASTLSASDFSCDDLIEDCCGEGGLGDCEHDGIEEAIDLIEDRCSPDSGTEGGGTTSGAGNGNGDGSDQCEATYENLCIACDDPPDGFSYDVPGPGVEGYALPQPDNCNTVVVICIDRGEPCSTLAHELTHHSQNCVIGFDNPDFWGIFGNNCNTLCAELEAFQVDGYCDSNSLQERIDNGDCDSCCECICQDYSITDCPDDCAALCDGIDDCCEGGLYSCESDLCGSENGDD